MKLNYKTSTQAQSGSTNWKALQNDFDWLSKEVIDGR